MQNVYATALELLEQNKPGLIGTIIKGNAALVSGSKFLVDEHGNEVVGALSPESLGLLHTTLVEVVAEGKPRLVEFSWQGDLCSVFLDPISPRKQLVICGGGHIALPVVEIAKLLGFQVTVIDDRLSFANQQRFPAADRVICQDFRQALSNLVVDFNTFVVIVTRGHRHDRTCLEEILNKPTPGYIGMIGSRRKIVALTQELLEAGFAQGQLQTVHAPIGLNIGAETPEEIAVSIMAEIIQHSHRAKSPDGRKGGA